MKNNKILVIGPTPPPFNGMSAVTEMILNSNLQKKFKIVHLDTADRRSLSNIGKIDFINVYLALKHCLKFLLLCVKKKTKVVYLHISQGIWGYLRDCLFLIPAKLLHKKIVVHLHGSYFRNFYGQSNKIMKLLIRWTLKDVSRVIVLGENLRYIFEGFVPEEKIAVIPNGIDKDEYDNLKIDHNPQASEDNHTVLFLSSLTKTKGFIDTIHAILLVLKERKDVKFIFAGQIKYAKEKEQVFRFIDENMVQPFLSFLGVVEGENKARLFLSSDIFVFPSHNEGQPFVILEAMAAGLPIISTDTGTIKEMVVDGENGFIVEMENPKQIAEKTLLLLEDEDLRKEMGRKSRARFLKCYTKDKFIGKLTQVFEEVLSESK